MRTCELRDILLTARGPAALLNAERGDADLAGLWRQDEADGQHAILLAALHNIARLDEHILGPGVFDLQFVDAAGLDHAHRLLGHRLLQRQRHGA